VLDISIPVPGTLYPALGAGIRGLSFFANNNEINLVGADVEKEFRGVQYEHLISLWRVAVPVIALVCLCALISTDIYLVKKSTTIAQEVANKMPSGDIQELNELEASARTFNEAVSRVRAIQTATSPVAPILQKVLGIVKNNGVAIQTVSYDANSQKIAFVGTTNTEAQVVAFKQALSKEESFENIEFSLANIRTTTQGVSFSVDFTVKK
jgi:Tfp pilus assembly protein PilN